MDPVWPPVAVNSNEHDVFADRGYLSEDDATAVPATILRDKKLRMLTKVAYKKYEKKSCIYYVRDRLLD